MSPTPASARSSPVAHDGVRRKTTLFCPDCGHASPVDGDWRVHTASGRQRLRCPECRTVVDDRHAAAETETPVQRCVDALDHYVSAWTSLVGGDRATECDC